MINNMPEYVYYYDMTKEEIKQLAQTPYKVALNLKIAKAKQLLTKLLVPGFMEQDTYRINKVSEAIKFNNRLLDELKE